MRTNWVGAILKRAAILLAFLGLCRPMVSQEVSLALLRPEAVRSTSIEPIPVVETAQPTAMEPVAIVKAGQPTALPEAPSHRRFWDHENRVLFATNTAFSAADFVVTRDNLRGGGQELNPVTRVFSGSTPRLAANFAAETAGVIGISYFFHKTGHYKLERAVSMLNISASAAAVAFDLAHR
jgi:hypothetical protein